MSKRGFDKKTMLPSSRDWIFSIKTFGAAMLALYLALKWDLPRPYWAMATVYIVSNPFVGATISKAMYRVIGTLMGAAAAIALVPPLVDTPYLLSLALAVWTGTMLFLAISTRTAKSYMFLLAGYTTPLISYPTVFDPTAIFDVETARTEEILLGIVVASIVNTVLFPNRLAPVLSERTVAWFRDAAYYARETLAGIHPDRRILDGLRRMAFTLNGLEVLLSQLGYDGARPDVVSRANELRGRMALLLPIIAALADPLRVFMASAAPEKDRLVAAASKISAWISDTQRRPGSHPDSEVRQVARELRADLGRIQPTTQESGAWHGMLLSSILWRLNVLVDLWEDCISLQHAISIDDVAHWHPQFRHWRFGAAHQYVDRWIILLATMTGVGGIFVACALWIQSDWVDGGSGIALASVACCFFAGLDDPAPDVFRFFVASAIAIVIAGLYLFAVLPGVSDFELLMLVFAPPFIAVGTLMPRPSFGLTATIVAFNTSAFLSLQGMYDANLQTFLNGNLSGLVGLLFAYLWTCVTRPFGATLAVRRLTRSGWRELAIAAGAHAIPDQRELLARMLDRVMQLIARLEPTDDPDHAAIVAFRDIRTALNTMDLRIERNNVPAPIQVSIDRVLERLEQYFLKCAKSGVRQPLGLDLIGELDGAIAQTGRAVAEGLPSASLHALVLLRISVSPDSVATFNGQATP